MKQRIWVKKASSYSEARFLDDSYYLSLTPKERLETIQFLREEYRKLEKSGSHEGGKRLRRVLKLIKQA